MKRCSQCGFTFEKNEQFCDFDGTELTTVPEPIPFYQKVPPKVSPNISMLRGVTPSGFRRLALSPVSLALLALIGLISSALLIGYYDSARRPNTDLASNPESQNDNPIQQGPSETSDQAKPEQVEKPKSISTQRRIKADEKSSSMPASMLKWESAASHSSRPRPGPSTSKLKATSTAGTRASRPRPEKTNRQSIARVRPRGERVEALARKQKERSTKSNRELQAKNHTRSRSKERVFQRPSTSEVAIRRPGREWESSRPQKESKTVAISRDRESQSAHQQKDSKVVAILKKTGSILTRPFRF